MSKDACRITYTDARESDCMDVYNKSMGMPGRTCLYISTEVTAIQKVTSMDDFTAKTVVLGISSAYDKYGRYKTKQDICMEVLGKIRKVKSYADSLQQSS